MLIERKKLLYYYRDILFREFESKCFYCGKTVNLKHVAVDHFIPWSFIKDDNLWNFVLACPACNSRKSDKLANAEYLDILVKRNEGMLIEQFPKMRNYRSVHLRKVYDWARFNGYKEIWTPKNISKP